MNNLRICDTQLCPRARSTIKYLVADRRYDYIETGSLISIKENVEIILIPSEERHLYMHPMDFEEFLCAMGNNNLMSLILKEENGIVFLPLYMNACYNEIRFVSLLCIKLESL